MNSSVPDYTQINFSVEKEEAHKMIDFGVNLYRERENIRNLNKKWYDSYNGVINKREIDAVVKKHGKQSSTPYISYRIGRNKIKQLIGEFLQIGIQSTIYTINPEAQKEKYDKYIDYMGMAKAKPMIEKARQQGMNVYPGYKIPDETEAKITSRKFKGMNEIIMQTIIDWKLIREDLLNVFLENWKQLILTSEMCSKLERDEYFSDILRPIDPNNAIFIESAYDPFVKESFIKGERREMFKHQVLQEFALDFEENRGLLKDLEGIETIQSEKNNVKMNSGEYLYEVFSFQFMGKKTVRKKESTGKNGTKYTKFISDKDYKANKKKINKDVKLGKYAIIEEVDMTTIFEGTRIGSNMYLGIREKENNIVTTDGSGFDVPKFDYIFALFNTVSGVRVSLQEIVYEMEKVYNAVRRQLNLEISKLRGDMAIFDEAFMTGKTPFTETLHKLSEHGIATMNSAEEGAVSDDNETVIDKFVKTFKLGDSQTISTLLQLTLDIEQTLDRVTGMNQDRQGVGNASSTATTNQNNVNASVSMTYDMFHFISLYINEILGRLAEKVKINWTWLENNEHGMILSDEEYGYLKATKDLSNDSYGAFVTEGKFEFEVKRKLEQYFLQEINAQNLRTLDVAKFYNNKSFAGSLKVLEDAYQVMQKTVQQNQQQKSQSDEKIAGQQQEGAMKMHEDTQEHEIQKIKEKGDQDRKTKSMDNDQRHSAIVNEDMRKHVNEQGNQAIQSNSKREEIASKERIEANKVANQGNNPETQ